MAMKTLGWQKEVGKKGFAPTRVLAYHVTKIYNHRYGLQPHAIRPLALRPIRLHPGNLGRLVASPQEPAVHGMLLVTASRNFKAA
ncbi:MAG: hypothetical protein WCJ35_28120 [Planctomycetota bacterium]